MVFCPTLSLVIILSHIFVGTIAHLRAKKQRYKLAMFQKLHYLLMFTIVIIGIFFVVSTMSFSGRLAEGTFLCPTFAFYVLFFITTLQIILLIRGAFVGGCWMVGLPSYTSLVSLASFSCGALAPTTEDEFHFLHFEHTRS